MGHLYFRKLNARQSGKFYPVAITYSYESKTEARGRYER
jgi:hypothetical protein